MRDSTGRHDDDVRALCEHVALFSPGVEPKLDSSRDALLHTPIDDSDHLLAARTPYGQPNLSTRFTQCLEYHDVMSALCRDSRRLQARGTCTHDDDFALALGWSYLMRHEQFAAGSGIVDAVRGAALVDAIQAVVGAYARPYLGLQAG